MKKPASDQPVKAPAADRSPARKPGAPGPASTPKFDVDAWEPTLLERMLRATRGKARPAR